ncbi:MAG: hypothetical protein IIB60_04130 [Planctomycetes bacterium]|nr:hypothetical protein [Planctomycetota bacterium]
MSTSTDNWFVEEFHLRSPVEEFQEFSRLELERARNADPGINDAVDREAVDLVLRRLRGERTDAQR